MMHPTQLEILDSLRQYDAPAKFSELLRDVAETSDNLTYHLKQLQKAAFIESPAKGEYVLAESGLMYLNNNLELNHDLFPTVSCMLELHGPEGKILVMKKLKQPNINKLHLPTFGVTSNGSLGDQIRGFLVLYRIVATDLSFKCVYRERVKTGDNAYIFDKFFMVYGGNFSAYESEIEDRNFTDLSVPELDDSSEILPTTKDVVSLQPGSLLAEAVVNESS